jgi:hypothetical protein
MRANINIRDICREAFGDSPTNSVNIDHLFEANGVDAEYEIDIDELLEQEHVIGHFWGIDDVQEVRPDLSDDQAWEVLQTVDRRLDSNLGINWEIVQIIADGLFPEPDEDDSE